MDNLIMLLEEMDRILQSMSPVRLKVREKDIQKFYEITKDSSGLYTQEDGTPIVSPTYFLTLLAPLATKLIVKILEQQELLKVKGVIHSQSEINFIKPIFVGKYSIWSRVETLQRKRGKTGNYLVLTFRMSLFNEKEEEVANDIHQFFIRVAEEGN